MIKGKTQNGFEFSLDERIKTDFRLVLAINNMKSASDDKKVDALISLVNLLLGEDGAEKLISFVMEKNDGFCPTPELMAEVTEILKTEEIKN